MNTKAAASKKNQVAPTKAASLLADVLNATATAKKVKLTATGGVVVSGEDVDISLSSVADARAFLKKFPADQKHDWQFAGDLDEDDCDIYLSVNGDNTSFVGKQSFPKFLNALQAVVDGSPDAVKVAKPTKSEETLVKTNATPAAKSDKKVGKAAKTTAAEREQSNAETTAAVERAAKAAGKKSLNDTKAKVKSVRPEDVLAALSKSVQDFGVKKSDVKVGAHSVYFKYTDGYAITLSVVKTVGKSAEVIGSISEQATSKLYDNATTKFEWMMGDTTELETIIGTMADTADVERMAEKSEKPAKPAKAEKAKKVEPTADKKAKPTNGVKASIGKTVKALKSAISEVVGGDHIKSSGDTVTFHTGEGFDITARTTDMAGNLSVIEFTAFNGKAEVARKILKWDREDNAKLEKFVNNLTEHVAKAVQPKAEAKPVKKAVVAAENELTEAKAVKAVRRGLVSIGFDADSLVGDKKAVELEIASTRAICRLTVDRFWYDANGTENIRVVANMLNRRNRAPMTSATLKWVNRNGDKLDNFLSGVFDKVEEIREAEKAEKAKAVQVKAKASGKKVGRAAKSEARA